MEYGPEILGDKNLKLPKNLTFNYYFVAPGKFAKSHDSWQNLQIPGRILILSRNSFSESWHPRFKCWKVILH